MQPNEKNTNKAAVNLKTGRFDNVDSAVIISSVCKLGFTFPPCILKGVTCPSVGEGTDTPVLTETNPKYV